MPGPFALIVWLLCTLFEASVVACSLAKGSFRRYLAPNVYMLVCFLTNVGRFKILSSYGLNSVEYAYFYYYSDLLLIIGLFFALISLYSQVFEEMGAEKYVRFGAVLLLLGTSIVSFAIVEQSSGRIVSRLVVEVAQNLYFVGLVLTYLLWGAILKVRETRAQLVQVVLSLGLYFSVFAASCALRNLYPSLHSVWPYLMPIADCILPLTWAYAFWRVPEAARMVPRRLAAVAR